MLVGTPQVGVGSKAGGFTPAAIAGLKLWLDAALGVHLSGSNVTQWDDQSGIGNNFAASGVPTFGATAFNGVYPGISFSAANGMTGNPSVAASAARTAFVVFNVAPGATGSLLLNPNGSGSYSLEWSGTDGAVELETNAVTTNCQYISLSGTAGNHVLAFTFDGNQTHLPVLDVDASQAVAGITNLNGAGVGTEITPSGVQTIGMSVPGARTGLSSVWAAALVYDTALAATNRARVYNYYKARCGL
jgi:hypothetical protein